MLENTSPKGFIGLQVPYRELDVFKIRNFLIICLEISWIFLGFFWGGIFGGIFWIFLEDFLGTVHGNIYGNLNTKKTSKRGKICKVENILKGSLDSIPSSSPSVKIQIMGGKICLRCKGKTLLAQIREQMRLGTH